MGSAATYLSLGPGWSSAANTPFRRHKTWVHEGGIATPLIAHWPAGIRARGELRHAPAHLIDLVPTLLDISGGAKPPVIGGVSVPAAPGRSLTGVFAREEAILRDDLWWEHDDHRGIRAGPWKLVALANQPWELYDLSRDRGETRNLASAQPDRVQELAGRWTRQRDANRQLALTDLPPDPAPKKQKTQTK
jgi:arylsulfatase